MPSRKVFLAADAAGESTAYWETEWEATDPADDVAAMRADPPVVIRLLESLLPPAGLVVEAGSGNGAIARLLTTEARRVIGIDLAHHAQVAAGSLWPDGAWLTADLADTPLKDCSVDAVVSLGVVEHTEAGPGVLLREARRVLRPGGVLLVSVPTIGLWKAVSDTTMRTLRRPAWQRRGRWVTHEPVGSTGAPSSDWSFHQYEFTRRRFDAELATAGLEVETHVRHLVSAGAGEVPAAIAGRLTSSNRPPDRSSAGRDPATGDASQSAGAPSRGVSALRGVVSAAVREEQNTAFQRLATGAARSLLAHMDLTVARRPK